MSDLQLALAAGGGVFIVAVIAYNLWQERRARRKAEKAFGEAPADALFEPAAQRREPVIGALPGGEPPAAPGAAAPEPPVPAEELEASGGPAAEVSSRIDTVAVVLADDPVMREQLEPLVEALGVHRTPVHIEGIVDEQWHPVEFSPRQSWRELRVGLQLASRAGPLGEEEIQRFNDTIAEFAAGVNAVSQRESPAAAAGRARELDAFCAEADIEVALNVVGQFGATFAVPRVKSLALELGLSETAGGDLVSFARDGTAEFVVRRLEEPAARHSAQTYGGLTFALDVPHVADPVEAFDDMLQAAEQLALKLGGQLVDDNRKPLTDAGIATIRRTVEQVAREMEGHGIAAGSPLARRLFS